MAKRGMAVMRTRKDNGSHGYGDEYFHEPSGMEIPWRYFDTEEARLWCQRNHDQTPEELRSRGGLSAAEAMLVLTGTRLSMRSIRNTAPARAAAWVTHLIQVDEEH